MNTQQKKTIQSFYSRLHRITESSRYFEEMTSEIKREERAHRAAGARFTNGQAKYNAPNGIIAEYFAVKYVFDGLTTAYSIESAAYIRHTCITGAAIASQYRAAITAEFAPAEIAQFASLDYCELIK